MNILYSGAHLRNSIRFIPILFLASFLLLNMHSVQAQCAPGERLDATGSICEVCPGGTFGIDGFECMDCPPGYFSLPGSINCQPCPVGTFSDTPGTDQCTACPPGTYQNQAGSIQCLNCNVSPSMEVLYNDLLIIDGAGADLGAFFLCIGDYIEQSFVIRNTGTESIIIPRPLLSGSPYFTITQYPTALTIDPGEEYLFWIRFDPVVPGNASATVEIEELGSCRTFSFTIQGEASILNSEPPVIICQENITVPVSAGECGAIVDYDFYVPVVSDLCGGALLEGPDGPASGSFFAVPTVPGEPSATITYYATDMEGNQSSCSFTITVLEAEPPVIVCKPDFATDCRDISSIEVLPGYGVDQAIDNCGSVTVTGPSPTTLLAGTVNILSWIATDGSGNASSCQQSITVNPAPLSVSFRGNDVIIDGDNTPDLIDGTDFGSLIRCTGTEVITQFFEITNIGSSPLGTPTLTLNGSPYFSISYNPEELELEPSGTTIFGIRYDPVSLGLHQATLELHYDVCGAQVYTFSIQGELLIETTPPVITCPANITVNNDPGQCGAIVTYDLPTATDNCGPVTLTRTRGPASGGYFNSSTYEWTSPITTVTYKATDGSGNTAECSLTVRVNDNESPEVTCRDVTVSLGYSGYAEISPASAIATLRDNCNMPSPYDFYSSYNYSVYPSLVECRDLRGGYRSGRLSVRDNNGNYADCYFSLTVVDNIKPNAICKDITVQLDYNGNASITTNSINNGSYDNCSLTHMTLDKTSFVCSDLGNNTVTLTAYDQSGNNSSCKAMVTVEDVLSPNLQCRSNYVNISYSGTYYYDYGSAELDPNDFLYNSGDNCGIVGFNISPRIVDCYDVGDEPVDVVITAYDAAGNSRSCSTWVWVSDYYRPSVICQDITVNLSSSGTGNINIGSFITYLDDNCPISLSDVSLSRYTFNCDDIGDPISVTASVTDAADNTDTDACLVTVRDISAPTALCQDTTVQLGIGRTVTVDPLTLVNSSDACGIASTVATASTFTCDDIGDPIPVEVTVTDIHGNARSCTAQVTIADDALNCNEPPVAICRDLTVTTGSGGCQAGVIPAVVDNGSYDPEGGYLSYALDNSGPFGPGSHIITLTVTDLAGKTDDCSATFTVVDNSAPEVVCQDITVELNGSGEARVFSTDVLVSNGDNCDSVTIVTPSYFKFTCTDVGVPHPVTFTVSDASANESSCTVNVTVLDLIPPRIFCRDYLVPNVYEVIEIPVSELVVSYSDLCGEVTLSPSLFNFNCEDLGDNVVEVTATDINGNVNTCQATVTINDHTRPTVECRDITISLDSQGEALITPADVVTYIYDNCFISDTILSQSSFNCANVGIVNVIAISARDYSGNQGNNYCRVTVNDVTPPTIYCSNITVQLGFEGIALLAPANLATYSDACGINDALLDIEELTCEDLGPPVKVTVKVTDENGLVNSCVSLVTVDDTQYPCNQPPVAVCQNITIEVDANCQAFIEAADIDGGSADPDLDPISFSADNTGPFSVGLHIVQLTVMDPSGEVDHCNAMVTVEDNTDPTAICRDINVQLGANGQAILNARDLDGGSTDNCGIALWALPEIGDEVLVCANVGSNNRTLVVTDVNGNSSSCSSTVTVEDNIAPVISCDAVFPEVLDQSAPNYAGSAAAGTRGMGQSFTAGLNGQLTKVRLSFSQQNNQPVEVFIRGGEGGNGPIISSVELISTPGTTRSWKEITFTNPPTISAGQKYTVWMVEPISSAGSVFTYTSTYNPTYPGGRSYFYPNTRSSSSMMFQTFVKASPVFNTYPGQCGSVVSFADATATDNCGVNVVAVPASGSFFPVGTTTVTFTATDASSNSSSCSVDVTVIDNEDPVLVCPANFAVNTDPGTCAAVIDGGRTAPLQATDNCGTSLEYFLTGSPYGLFSAYAGSGNGPIGTTTIYGGSATIEYILTDPAGNSATCSFTITVNDAEPPVVTCPDDITVNTDPGQCSAVVNYTVSLTENCPFLVFPPAMAPEQISGQASGTVFPQGQTLNTYSFTDAQGNSSSCSFTVTVNDMEPPIAICVNATVQLDASGSAIYFASTLVAAGSSDNCGIATFSPDEIIADCSNLGNNPVAVLITDIHGNSSICTATVTIEDHVAPVANCKDITVELDALGNGGITAIQVDNNSGDACGIVSYVLDIDAFNCSNTGSNAVTLTVTDGSGNASKCRAVITVQDHVAPEALCRDITVTLDPTGNISVSTGEIDNGSSDACGIASLSLSPSAFTCAELGENDVTLTVIDVHGNTATCTATVTVEGIVPSVAITEDVLPAFCQGGTIVLTANSAEAVAYAWSTGETSDIIQVNTDGVYEVTVTSATGCSATESYSISGYDASALLSSYTILATDGRVKLEKYNTVGSGGLGVMNPDKKAELKDHSVVSTFVRAAEIKIDGSSSVAQEILAVSNVTLPPFVDNPYNSNNDVDVKDDEVVVLSDCIYGKLDIKKNATVTFTCDNVFIKELKAKEGLTINFSGSANVFIKKKVALPKNTIINAAGETVTVYVGDNLEVSENSDIHANIYSASDIIAIGKIGQPINMTGMFIADNVEGKNQVNWNWDTYCDPANVVLPALARVIVDESVLEQKLTDSGLSISAYPNPFSDRTVIEFTLSETAETVLEIFNLNGMAIDRLKLGELEPFVRHKVEFATPAGLSAGTYIYRIVSGKEVATGRLVIVK